MNLLEQIKASEKQIANDAAAAYREIILRSDSPIAGDEKNLSTAMSILGKTSADLDRDLQIARQAAALSARAEDADDEALAASLDAASGKYEAFDAETRRIAQERKTEGLRLFSEFRGLQARITAGRKAVADLDALKGRHPKIWPADPRPAIDTAPIIRTGDPGMSPDAVRETNRNWQPATQVQGSAVPCEIGRRD